MVLRIANPGRHSIFVQRGQLVALLGFLLSAALLALAFRDVLTFEPRRPSSLSVDGFEGTLFSPQSGGFLLFQLTAAWLIWRSRTALLNTGGPLLRLQGLPLLALGVLLFGWAAYVEAKILLFYVLPIVLLAIGWTLGGVSALVALMRPALLLWVSAPLPGALLNSVVFPLQTATVRWTTWVLDTAGIAVSTAGDRIFTSSGIFQVIETCSGLGIMTTITATAVIYSAIFEAGWGRTFFLVLIAPILGFVINLGRVLSIIFHPTSAVSVEHQLQGLSAIVVGVLALAAIDRLTEGFTERPETSEAQSVAADRKARADALRPEARARLLLLNGFLVVLVAIRVLMPSWEATEESPKFPHLPLQLEGWRSSLHSPDRLFLGSVGFTDEAARRYSRQPEGEHVTVLVARDTRLNPQYSLISPKTAIPGSGWVIRDEQAYDLPWADGAQGRLLDLEGRNFSERVLSLQWTEGIASGHVEIFRNALALDRGPWRRESGARLVRLTTPVEDGPLGLMQAKRRLREFGSLLASVLLGDPHVVGSRSATSLDLLGSPRGRRSTLSPRGSIPDL